MIFALALENLTAVINPPASGAPTSFMGTLPGWITSLFSAGTFATVMTVSMQWSLKSRKMTLDDAAAKRGEKVIADTGWQTRMDAMAERFEASEKEWSNRLDNTEKELHGFEMKLQAVLVSYRILDVEVATRWPDSSALAQARAVMSTAFALAPETVNSVPRETLDGLDKIKGTGE